MVPPRPYVQSSNLDTYTCSSKWISGNTDAGGRGVGGLTRSGRGGWWRVDREVDDGLRGRMRRRCRCRLQGAAAAGFRGGERGAPPWARWEDDEGRGCSIRWVERRRRLEGRQMGGAAAGGHAKTLAQQALGRTRGGAGGERERQRRQWERKNEGVRS